jgi:predicted acetyltransferase
MDPSLTLRSLTDDDFLDWNRAMARVFLESFDEKEAERWRPLCPFDRFVTVTSPDGAHVGTAGSFPLSMSVPGWAPHGCAAVTAVTVRPDWRRRGVLTAMMQRLLEDAAAAGEPWAALYASEGTIYGRYGFGPAADRVNHTVGRDALATVDGDPGLVEVIDADAALAAMPPIADAYARQRGGTVLRDQDWWRDLLMNHQESAPGSDWGARWHAVVPGRGYAMWRGKDGDWTHRRPAASLRVSEVVATDPEALNALLGFLASIDLVQDVRFPARPVDDPLRFAVANEAAVDTVPNLPLWVRLIDLPAALTGRGYDVTDRLVLEVGDDQLPSNAGRWSLEVGPDDATCQRTDDPPDVVLPTGHLATLSLGGFSATRLADAGHLPGTDPSVIRRLDRLFAVARAPWSAFDF